MYYNSIKDFIHLDTASHNDDGILNLSVCVDILDLAIIQP